ncbi:MAG: hypothetical protein BAJALOKI1v1_470002 [Promethearchaeota archaeon]|nr:MAG: hypothetical protein BAJALOKI1v1_470002 [Candidatus Lokiarchaeota archaeon]
MYVIKNSILYIYILYLNLKDTGILFGKFLTRKIPIINEKKQVRVVKSELFSI